MASSAPISIPGLLGILFGAFIILIAFSSPLDHTFCSSGCGNSTQPIFDWLYSRFGHWGPRTLMILIGAIFVIVSWRKRWKSPQGHLNREGSSKDAI